MRTAALTLLSFVAFGYAAEAQKFTLLPQVGFENSKTTIRFNDLSSFSPAGVVFTPQVSLQLNYRSKPGHGFFVGAASSRSVVPLSFTDPESAMNNYTYNTGKIQLRLEGGYQFSSKPIYFRKAGNSTGKTVAAKTTQKKSCSYAYRSHCLKNKQPAESKSGITQSRQKSQLNKGSWMRLLPSLGLGFIPVSKEDLVTREQNGATTYEYRAGNFNTAMVTGMGFEFGKNDKRLITVNVNYLKGIGNPGSETISSLNGTKTVTTHLKSDISAWNLRVGIPFSLGAKKPAVKQEPQKAQPQKQGCRKYEIRYKCNKLI